MNTKYILSLLGVILIIIACGNKPKVIEQQPTTLENPHADLLETAISDEHEVVVNDFFHTNKYTYLNVIEGGEAMCVAIPLNSQIEKGGTYYYKGGLRMNTFEKLPFEQNFQTVHLVSGVSNIPLIGGNIPGVPIGASEENSNSSNFTIEGISGGVKLAELFSNREKYNGQTILVKGKCVKVNRQIMDRNWIHIQDGDKDANGENYDLTVTTKEDIQNGAIITFEGKISLNKDFGAGYKYEIILEDAQLKLQ